MRETEVATVQITGTEGFGAKGWGSYPWLWAATAVSSFGDGVRLAALPLLAVTYTRDPALLALVTAAGLLPLLLSPLAGVAADRWPRRAVLITADLARLVLVAGLALAVVTGVAGFWLVCGVALLLGVCEVLFTVISQTFLPEVVHPARMTAAYGRQYAAQVVFRDTIGQPLGGLLFVAGAAAPFFADASSFLAGVLLLTVVRPVASEPPVDPAARPGWGQMVREGYHHLRNDRLLLLLAGMSGYLNFFIAGVGALMVVYVIQQLRLDPELFGFLMAAGALGGVLGGLLGSRLQQRFSLFPTALSGLAVAGAAILLLGTVREPLTAAVLLAVMTFGGVIYSTLTVSFRLTTVPPSKLGRVNGAYRLIGIGPAPIGALTAGLVARQFGVQVPFLISGAAVLLLVAVATRPILRLAAAGSTDPAPSGATPS